MLKGEVQHEDFKGHKGIIAPGDVQWMQAAKGIVHSEMPIHGDGRPDPVGLQLWLDLPAKRKMDAVSGKRLYQMHRLNRPLQPDYQEYRSQEMPYAHPSENVGVLSVLGVDCCLTLC